NPYTYVPVVNFCSLGREARDDRCSLSQLTAIYEPADGGDLVQTQFYSYRSLLTFKLMKEVPLGSRHALRALRLLMNAFGILGINHADCPAPNKSCALRRGAHDQPDELQIDYAPTPAEKSRQAAHERQVLKCFKRLGCWPLKRVSPGEGSSIHYAGTLPIEVKERELTCDRDCRLRGTRNVYLADGSVFGYLPAKGLTLSIMANADRIGVAVSARLATTTRRAAA
ncbi:MAG TPA: GMC oxidoreductase, partial [Pirellulales bacterium]|nr:GMC oxidoreductase [Pirellulales bacterium]